RFFDSAVEPGKTYEYRFKIKLTNPNKDKAKEVAYKELADKPFVESNWIELKQRIIIPPDFRYFAIDVKELTPADMPHKGAEATIYKTGAYHFPPEGAVAMQLQRWVDWCDLTGHKEPVGDWAIAEQVFFKRGEFVGGSHNIQMPVWSWFN